MSLLSKVGSAVKSYASNVIGGAKIVGSAIGSALGGSNSANASMSFPVLPGVNLNGANQSLAPNMTVAPRPGDTGGPGNYSNGTAVSINSPASVANRNSAAANASSTFSLGSTPTTISSRSSGSPSVSSFSPSISAPIASDTLTGTLGASNNLSSGGANFNAGATQASAPSNSYPSAPSVSNPGKVNLGGTASALTGMYALNPQTGVLEPVSQDQVLEEQRKTTAKNIRDMIPQKDSVLSNPDVQAKQNDVNQKKEELNNLTAQLNQVSVDQNQTLANLRDVGAREGVTDTVFGQQEAAVNRNYAMKALPIQAQVAAAQGNLGLAQDYLAQTVKIVSENIDNNYNYRKSQFDWAAQFATGEDKIKLDALNKQNDRSYAQSVDDKNFAQSLALKAFENGQAGLGAKIMALLPNSGSPTFMNDVQNLAGGLINETARNNSTGATGFMDVLQQAINSDASPEQAARAAAMVSENSGIPVDQKTLAFWVSQAKQLKKTVAPATSASSTAAPVDKRTAQIESEISNLTNYYTEQKKLSPSIDVNQTVKSALKSKGYTNQEIIDSSVGSSVDQLITGVSKFLFGN